MKAARIITGTIAAGLAAALLAGAFWAQDTDIDSDRYVVSGDVISLVGAVGGALCIVLAANLIFRGARSR
jgi:hypothetical protein